MDITGKIHFFSSFLQQGWFKQKRVVWFGWRILDTGDGITRVDRQNLSFFSADHLIIEKRSGSFLRGNDNMIVGHLECNPAHIEHRLEENDIAARVHFGFFQHHIRDLTDKVRNHVAFLPA
ncbi:hypothetical protein SDC9_193878 [bioreactor metagenome]|uniref:Uncharacterized protein n=1 Tax=bioreactor metagenome TaxID=1076179 RepID=A0A645IFZ9_9ZZZZ